MLVSMLSFGASGLGGGLGVQGKGTANRVLQRHASSKALTTDECLAFCACVA